jgi:hypothetical protein
MTTDLDWTDREAVDGVIWRSIADGHIEPVGVDEDGEIVYGLTLEGERFCDEHLGPGWEDEDE